MGPDCFGSVASHDYNVIVNTSGCTVSDKVAHNVTGVEPGLGPLQNNGGATFTQALPLGSVADGTGHPGTATGGSYCEATDQIGTPRIKNQCDIGAYQLPD